MKVSKIEIVFDVPVEPPEGFYRALDGLINMICMKYQSENPDRVMWPAGSGSKPLFNPYMVSDDEPLPFDNSIYFLECTEREDYHGNNPHNPRKVELQEAVETRRRQRKSEKSQTRRI